MWFDKSHIKQFESIFMDDLHGYVLPHAGTAHSGHVLSHTLRFKPTKEFTHIFIMYLPAKEKPNVDGKYFHEYYVPMKTLEVFFPDKIFVGYNVLERLPPKINKLTKANTLFVISADFSHHLLLQEAIKKENCAAHSLVHNAMNMPCTRVVDDMRTFKEFARLKKRIDMSTVDLQWVGRSRSAGKRGVGYLSFLMRSKPKPQEKTPNGFFVTAYDANMNQRECLGNTKMWSYEKERNLVEEVLFRAKTESRLLGGADTHVPVTHYSITYLYLKNGKYNHNRNEFIRGYHAVMTDALYLPDVFLENVYDDGRWILPKDTIWPQRFVFNMHQTLVKLARKAVKDKYSNAYKKAKNMDTNTLSKNLVLFETSVLHKKVNSLKNIQKNKITKNLNKTRKIKKNKKNEKNKKTIKNKND